ncbi:hypothetical protein Hanom_Chr10g00926391 [Helianthus anomalus]
MFHALMFVSLVISLTAPLGLILSFSNKIKYIIRNIVVSIYLFYKSKLQVLFFMFTSNCRRCSLAQKLTSNVLNVSKSCMLCPLGQTQLDFLVKYGHVQVT